MPAASVWAAIRRRALTERRYRQPAAPRRCRGGIGQAAAGQGISLAREPLFKNDAPHNDPFVAATAEKYYKRDPDEAVRTLDQSLSPAPVT